MNTYNFGVPNCGVGVLRTELIGVGVDGISSVGLFVLMVFFMISSSVLPSNLCPMLGNLFTILCKVFLSASVVANGEFIELVDAAELFMLYDENADAFGRFRSNALLL